MSASPALMIPMQQLIQLCRSITLIIFQNILNIAIRVEIWYMCLSRKMLQFETEK